MLIGNILEKDRPPFLWKSDQLMIHQTLTIFQMLSLKYVSEIVFVRYVPVITVVLFAAAAPLPQDGEVTYKDWVFINYTFKRFEGLTQRGTPTKK